MMPTTTITARVPTNTPALKIPVITEHPLKAIIARTTSNILNFFIGKMCL